MMCPGQVFGAVDISSYGTLLLSTGPDVHVSLLDDNKC